MTLSDLIAYRLSVLADWDRAVRRYRAWEAARALHASLDHPPLSRGERNGLSLAADHADMRVLGWGLRPPSIVGSGGVA